MIVIRTGRLEVPPGTGPRTVSDTHFFDRLVEDCWVALRGYWLRYEDGDHHVRTVGVELEAGLQDLEQVRASSSRGRCSSTTRTATTRSPAGRTTCCSWSSGVACGRRRRRPRARAGHGEGTGPEQKG